MVEDAKKMEQTGKIKCRYNRTASFYVWLDRLVPASLRRKVTEMAKGKVLEVGVGTGNNLPYYLAGCEVTGIDFSPRMLAKAKEKVPLAKVPVKLLEMDVQAMNFPDATFDTVIATCVFCSVPDPVQGLREIRRVCKPNGKVILLEHVRSTHPTLGRLMDMLNPFFLHLVGCNINRYTVENAQNAGLHIKNIENIHGKIVKLMIATP